MDLVQSFAQQGVPIDYIQIGNEINDGLLWPVGQISVNGFHPASELLHSAAQGVRAASSSTKIVVHIANGWDSSDVSYFWDGIFVQGAFATSDVDSDSDLPNFEISLSQTCFIPSSILTGAFEGPVIVVVSGREMRRQDAWSQQGKKDWERSTSHSNFSGS